MMSKEHLIARILVENGIDQKDLYLAKDANRHGRSGGYADIIIAELRQKRLTDANRYFTCRDFTCFDVKCCPHSCHGHYSHYDASVVTLADRSFAWVCCRLTTILTRDIGRRDKDPVAVARYNEYSVNCYQSHPKRLQLPVYELDLPTALKSIGPDEDYLNALVEANKAAESDDIKLKCCLRYVHHLYGRKGPGRQTIDALVSLCKTDGRYRSISAPAIDWEIAGSKPR
jgi:hypothetical protein